MSDKKVVWDPVSPFQYRVLMRPLEGAARKTVTHRPPRHKVRRECLARNHGGCGGGLSREHVVSETVLKVIPTFSFTNSNGEQVPVHKSNLTLRVLCRNHNSAITEIDDEAANFLQEWINLINFAVPPLKLKGTQPASFQSDAIFSGHLLEKWFLKTFLYRVMVHYRVGSATDFYGAIPMAGVECLDPIFGQGEISSPFGFYTVFSSVLKPESKRAFRFAMHHFPIEVFQPVSGVDHMLVPYGLELSLFGNSFFGFFNTSTIPDGQFIENVREFLGNGSFLDRGFRHPAVLKINGDGQQGAVRLRW